MAIYRPIKLVSSPYQTVPTFHPTSIQHLSDQMLASLVCYRMNMSIGPDILPTFIPPYEVW